MQTSHSLPSAQLPLFQEAFWASNGAPLLDDVIDSPSSASIEEPAAFSELSLSGLPGHCLTLLAPILRELSEEQDARWLTLIAPPASLTHEWLRRARPEPRAHPATAGEGQRRCPGAQLRGLAPGPQPHRGQLAGTAEPGGAQATVPRRPTGPSTEPEYSSGLKKRRGTAFSAGRGGLRRVPSRPRQDDRPFARRH